MKRGNGPFAQFAPFVISSFNGAALHEARKDNEWREGPRFGFSFNGAALHEARKCDDEDGEGTSPYGFNGAALHEARKSIRLSVAGSRFSPASTGPRFMKRGNPQIRRAPRLRVPASTGPRFMKRGNCSPPSRS